MDLLNQSDNSFLSQLFADYEFDSGSTKRKKTVLSKFKVNINVLTENKTSNLKNFNI